MSYLGIRSNVGVALGQEIVYLMPPTRAFESMSDAKRVSSTTGNCGSSHDAAILALARAHTHTRARARKRKRKPTRRHMRTQLLAHTKYGEAKSKLGASDTDIPYTDTKQRVRAQTHRRRLRVAELDQIDRHVQRREFHLGLRV